MPVKPWFRALLLLSLGGCALLPRRAATPEQLRAQLLDADRAFAAAAAVRGLDGWLEFLADDAVRIPRPGAAAVRGRAAIRELDAPTFADPAVQWRWQPLDAGVFADGRHGFTTGRFRLLRREGATERLLGEGAYVTWWRREEDGRWRVILHTGAPDAPGAAAPPPG